MTDKPATTDREERMAEALQRIASWADAYPLVAVTEPELLRHVITQVGHIAKGALQP